MNVWLNCRYDGQVYENLYKWASESPLNKSQVRAHIQHQSLGMIPVVLSEKESRKTVDNAR